MFLCHDFEESNDDLFQEQPFVLVGNDDGFPCRVVMVFEGFEKDHAEVECVKNDEVSLGGCLSLVADDDCFPDPTYHYRVWVGPGAFLPCIIFDFYSDVIGSFF